MVITKAVMQDIHGNTHIYRYPTYTYSEKVSCKCSKCGKKITRTFSTLYTTSPTEGDYQYLEKQKQEFLAEEHICSKCLKEACRAERKEISKKGIENTLTLIKDRGEQIDKLRSQISLFLKELTKDLEGKVCLYNNREYVVTFADYSGGSGYVINGHQINKDCPWTTTNSNIYINDSGKGWGGSNSVCAKFEEVTFTDEVFANRYKKIEELEK